MDQVHGALSSIHSQQTISDRTYGPAKMMAYTLGYKLLHNSSSLSSRFDRLYKPY
jgi:hypothetical protein